MYSNKWHYNIIIWRKWKKCIKQYIIQPYILQEMFFFENLVIIRFSSISNISNVCASVSTSRTSSHSDTGYTPPTISLRVVCDGFLGIFDRGRMGLLAAAGAFLGIGQTIKLHLTRS